MTVNRYGYGDEFGKRFGATVAPAFVTRSLRHSEIGVTHMVQRHPTHELTEKFLADDAYILSYVLEDSPNYTLWENDKPLPPQPILAGQITFNDVKTTPYMLVNDPMVAIHYYIPQGAFNALADTSDAPRISALLYPHGQGVNDPVIQHLSLALLPAFERQHEANRLFVDYVTLAVATHVARTYGDMKFYLPKRGGLAPWQMKRAQDMIDAHLDGDLTQDDLARECGLSRSHFARAFRISLGEPPHRWLLRRRIDRAKVMMLSSQASLADIAISCGFADQGHFTRIFNSFMNTPPGTWRRNNRN